jgi:hypothetical protein
MTVHEHPKSSTGRSGIAPLELFTDDDRVWTAIPVDATDEQRASRWLSIADEDLCDLEEWR